MRGRIPSVAVASLVLIGSAAWWSCGGDTSGPPNPPPGEPTVASVTVAPSSAVLQALGETEQFTATARDASGAVVSGKTFTWRSSDQGVASVSAAGLASAVANGAATVTATTDGVAGSAAVTVEVAATTGGLRLITTTVGRNLDPDGYTLVVDGALSQAVGPSDTVTVGNLDPGSYSATIDGLSPNCHSFRSLPIPASVVPGDTVDVTLGVECLDMPAAVSLTFTRAVTDPPSQHIAWQPAAGGTPEDLTFHPSRDTGPDWSPDGSRLAFSRDEVIFVVNADGTDLRSFQSRGPSVGRGSNPDWSPDGTAIVYDYREQILVIEPDGVGPDASLGPGSQPAWSPDGSKIAFEYYDPAAGEPEIFVMNADGSGRVNLTQAPARLDREPTWSPDGSRIAFRRGDRGDSNGYELWVMDADGGNQQKLLSLPGPQILPQWLPDNRILFVSDTPGSISGTSIWAIDLDAGGAVTQLTNEPGSFHAYPAWRPAH